MVNGQDVICWAIGVLFFILALSDITAGGYDLTVLESTRIIVYGMIGMAFTISGSIFHLQQESETK